jgi:oligoribonuclease
MKRCNRKAEAISRGRERRVRVEPRGYCSAMSEASTRELLRRPAPLAWIDLEMSGLEVERCEILEVALILTDEHLNEIAVGPHLVIHQAEDVLEAMDEWCTTQHGKSGLTAAVRASAVSVAEAEEAVLAFLRGHCAEGESPLCGNSVHFDRRFLAKYMPAVESYLHYRIIDVSTIKELVRRWYPEVTIPQKSESHRAPEDIRASIEELRYYREHVFR